MSKIEAKQQSSVSLSGSNQGVEKQREPIQQANRDEAGVYVENDDDLRDKYSARAGIERGRRQHNKEHDLTDKHKGDKVTILNGTTELVGTILSETKDTVDVLVGETVYTVAKNTGKARRQRKATEHEKSQQRIEQQNQAQEARSVVAREQIKETYQRYDLRMAEEKRQARIELPKKQERGIIRKENAELHNLERNKVVTKQFQVFSEDEKHQSLSIAEIILKQDAEKNDKI